MGNRDRLCMQVGALLFVIFFIFMCHSAQAEDDIYDDQTSITETQPALATHFMVSRLEAILPIYEDAIANPWPVVPNRLLHVGSKNSAVLTLRERLIRSHDLDETTEKSRRFDTELAQAVKQFQTRHGLKADGVVGNATVNELNVPPEIRVKQIKANIQRWTALSKELGHRYIWVNIPEYLLHVIDNDEEVLTIKAIVGKPDWQTPQFSSTVKRIVFNPTWSVPPTIAKHDIAKKVLENPDYLRENNIRIFRSEDSHAEVRPHQVNWHAAKENGIPYTLRQDSGENNALGLVKFEFPNSKNIYLHDTPVKTLFNSDNRALSHGCIRLEKPFDLVAYFIQNDDNLDEDKVRNILENGTTQSYIIKTPIPIYLTYITAWVDNHGVVNFRDDIYELDNTY